MRTKNILNLSQEKILKFIPETKRKEKYSPKRKLMQKVQNLNKTKELQKGEKKIIRTV